MHLDIRGVNTCDRFGSLCGEMETFLCLSSPEVDSAEAHCHLYFHKSESRADQTLAGGMASLFPCSRPLPVRDELQGHA